MCGMFRLQHYLTFNKTLMKGFLGGRKLLKQYHDSYFLNKPHPKLLWINDWANKRIGIFYLAI